MMKLLMLTTSVNSSYCQGTCTFGLFALPLPGKPGRGILLSFWFRIQSNHLLLMMTSVDWFAHLCRIYSSIVCCIGVRICWYQNGLWVHLTSTGPCPGSRTGCGNVTILVTVVTTWNGCLGGQKTDSAVGARRNSVVMSMMVIHDQGFWTSRYTSSTPSQKIHFFKPSICRLASHLLQL